MDSSSSVEAGWEEAPLRQGGEGVRRAVPSTARAAGPVWGSGAPLPSCSPAAGPRGTSECGEAGDTAPVAILLAGQLRFDGNGLAHELVQGNIGLVVCEQIKLKAKEPGNPLVSREA